MGQKCSGKSIAGIDGRRWEEESMITLYPSWDWNHCTDPRTPQLCRCWQAKKILPGIEDVRGKDYLQCMWPASDWKICSGAAIEVALVEILSPDIPFILFHMLLSVYYQNNVWPVQKYKKAKFLLLVLQTMWDIHSTSQIPILLELFFGFGDFLVF